MTDGKRIERIESLLEALLADRSFDSPVPLPMREAALACNIELRTLRQLVERKQIKAYRSGKKSMWRVFPKDVRAFLMAESNLAPARRMRVLKRAA
jgi:excisionase family DNA binding protein